MPLTPFDQMNVLQKFGTVLQNTANPNYIMQYNEQLQAEQMQQAKMEELALQNQQRAALQQLGKNAQGMNPLSLLQEEAAITGDLSKLQEYQIQQNDPLRQLQMQQIKAQMAAQHQQASQSAAQQKALQQYTAGLQSNITPQQQLGLAAGVLKPDDITKQQQQKINDLAALQQFQEAAQNLSMGAQDIKDAPGLEAATGSLQGSSWVPSLRQGTADADAKINNLKASVALQSLQNLKQASATGASGFGGLSGPELDILINSIASLDQKQGTPQFVSQLDKITQRANSMEKTALQKFNSTYGTNIQPVTQLPNASSGEWSVKEK